MVKNEDIEYAIKQTLNVHPHYINNLTANLYNQILKGATDTFYTKHNNARDLVRNITDDDLLNHVLTESIKTYNTAEYAFYNDRSICKLPADERKKTFLEAFPSFFEMQKIIETIARPDINTSLYLKANPNALFTLVSSVVDSKYKSEKSYQDYIEAHSMTTTYMLDGQKINLFEKTSKDIESAKTLKNIQVNHNALNKCVSDLLSGKQLKNKRNEYSLNGTLYATQDIGNKRKNQEDCVVIQAHPENRDFQLLAVADGIGGTDSGEKASIYINQKLSVWFNSLPKELFNYPTQLQLLFNDKIKDISKELYGKYNSLSENIVAGSTFVGAIVTRNQTIISSVGDSRAYALNGQNLELLTYDESEVWPLNRYPETINKEVIDDLRFNKANNKIIRFVGQKDLGRVQSRIVPNKDQIILCSDGVTDLLKTDRIKFFALNSNPESLTKHLVDEAMKYDAKRMLGETKDYYGSIPAGKDNTTVAAHIRR